jgi:predicted exporter
MSSTPALQAIGITTVLGISLAWLFTPLFRLPTTDGLALRPK